MQEIKDKFTVLSVFHFLIGGVSLLMSFVPVIYLIIGFILVIAPGGLEAGNSEEQTVTGWFFILGATLIIIVGLCIAAATIFAGVQMNRLRNYNFCFAVAVLECLFFPFGTILGVITLIMLSKAESKQAFGKPVIIHQRED